MPPIKAHGTNGWDLVYYEHAADSGIDMDFVAIQVSVDGTPGSWITIFDYGGTQGPSLYNNSSIAGCPQADNTNIPIACSGGATLIGGTGVGIDIDAAPGVVNGTSYNY